MTTSKLIKGGLIIVLFFPLVVLNTSPLLASKIKAKVKVIIERLPLDKQDRMRDFHLAVKDYIEGVQWLEDTDDDVEPIEITVQMFLNDVPSNTEDRFKCEFLISSTDVQYFDRRVRFPYQKDLLLQYNEGSTEPLTGIIDFYINMILGSELDKYGANRGDFYYKRAQNVAALGKFVRIEFIFGWLQRDELIKRVFLAPFPIFRKMKDYYFYGLYVVEESIFDARTNLRIALDMIETVLNKNAKLEEPKQFLDAHYLEFIEIFRDDANKSELFKKLKALDSEHADLYDEHISDS